MQIAINKLVIRNFKGLRDMEFYVLDVLNIYGKNRSGKTRIYDSWLWLLFGKDHKGRQDHELKTQGSEREHVEVSADISAGDRKIKLGRVYREEWVKPHGENEEVFKGNTTDYYINDVGVKKKEYVEFVAGLCSEELFKTITNPLYFTSLSKEQQRALLFSLIPEVTNEQVASDNEDFKAILKEVSGLSFENFKKELSSKMRLLKEDIDKIPVQIETTNRNMPESEDWGAIQASISDKETSLKEIEASMLDIAKRLESENKAAAEIQEQINGFYNDNAKIERQEKEQLQDDIERKESAARKLLMSIGDDERDYKTKKARLDSLTQSKSFYDDKINALREQWVKISAETLSFDENELICPTCEQSLPEHDIEEKQAHMQAAFNKSKAEKLEANKQEGIKIKEMLVGINEEIEMLNVPEAPDVSAKQAEIDRIKEEIAVLRAKTPQHEKSILYQANLKKIEELQKQLNNRPSVSSIADFTARKRELTSEIDSLKKRLYARDAIKKLQEYISELNERKALLNQELSDIERKEYIVKQFEYAKNAEYENRINMLFGEVQFRLFKEQINGQVVPDCEATMDGINFSSFSRSQEIYAGLDIIRTISNHEMMHAPIFIDNRESTTDIPEMSELTQIINLYVDPAYDKPTVK